MIGIFGGTFDPIHYGHLRIALDVQQALALEQVRFIPCGEPVHRNKPVATGTQRISMLRAAVKGQPGFIVDEREVRRDGPSYMVDTLCDLKDQIQDQSLCLMLGSDAFSDLDSWHHWQQIFELANIVVMQRPDAKNEFSQEINALVSKRKVPVEQIKNQMSGGGICFVPVTQLDISSTLIRQYWQQGKDIRFFLPDEVITLIKQQDIYD